MCEANSIELKEILIGYVLAKYHLKIANIRNDYLHKTTHKISKENQFVAMENLNVSGMMKNHKLAQSISDVGWHEFKRQLEYKCKWRGRELVIVDRFFPSSKLCGVCNTINQELTLKDREWTCQVCKTVHDRDFNASINIKKQGLKILSGLGTNSDIKQKTE